MILFTKYSNDRGPAYQIRTDIVLEDGVRAVRKSALRAEGRSHIERMAASEKELAALFEGTRFKVNRCRMDGASACFEYLEGQTLEEELDAFLPGRVEELTDAMTSYLQEIDKTAKEPFRVTEGFRQVFPMAIEEEGRMATAQSDLDLVLNNVIVTGDEWNVIDYEWTMPFPVPVDYIKWRVIHYYVRGNSARSSLREDTLFQAAGIDRSDLILFGQMETAFQNWISEGSTPLWKLYPDISVGAIRLSELEQGSVTGGKMSSTVYFDRGQSFSEDDTMTVTADENGSLRVTIPVAGVRALRFDPAETACGLSIQGIWIDGTAVDVTTLMSNGHSVNHRDYTFTTSDPQILLPALPENAKELQLVCRLHLTADAMRQTTEEVLQGQQDAILMLNQRINSADQTLVNVMHAVHAVEETKVIRTYREARARLKKTDPFASIRPELVNGQGVYLSVDRRAVQPECIYVMGWFVDPQYPGEQLRVVKADGTDATVKIRRVMRKDVNEALQITDGRYAGFDIEVSYDHLDELPLYLRIENPRGVLLEQIDLIRDPKERKLARAAKREAAVKAGQTLPLQEYDDWAMDHEKTEAERSKEKKTVFPLMPKFSIVVPLYETPRDYLLELVDSVRDQTYENWELILADGSQGDGLSGIIKEHYTGDLRIRYIHLTSNEGISGNTNAGLREAKGDFVVFADHDDVLDRSALFELARAINQKTDVDVVYTDEDKITSRGQFLFGPNFKPDYDPDYLAGNNYICHIFCVRKTLIDRVGGLRSEYDGAQDFDLVLRATEEARSIEHVAKALYHWRSHAGSTAGNPESKMYAFENGRKAVEAHWQRLGLPARVELTDQFGHYRTIFEVQGSPKVSILIPNRDHADLLRRAVYSILGRTQYENYEIVIIENGSSEEETTALYEELTRADARVRVVTYTGTEFNYPAINNFGVRESDGEYLLFLNNDTEVIGGDWLTEMLSLGQREDVGAVGAFLTYPDGSIQHCGVILGIGGLASHMFGGMPSDEYVGGGRANSTQDLSAVTAACMLTKRTVFEAVGGFDEAFAVAYNDVDYCLKVRAQGLLVATNAFARLTHYESASRGADTADADPVRHARFLKEAALLKERWSDSYPDGDPYYNPNLTVTRPDFSLRT